MKKRSGEPSKGDPQSGSRDAVGAALLGRGRKIEERQIGPRIGFAVGVEQVVCANVILIDGLLHQTHAQQAGVERQIFARFGRNRRQMMDSRQLHCSLLRVIESPLKTGIAGLGGGPVDVGCHKQTRQRRAARLVRTIA